ncbi:MAG: hypothetical protein ABI865_06475, partial [Nitrosospira sp.]
CLGTACWLDGLKPGIISQIARTRILEKTGVSIGRETERRDAMMQNRDFLQCAVTNEVKMRVLLHSSFQKL